MSLSRNLRTCLYRTEPYRPKAQEEKAEIKKLDANVGGGEQHWISDELENLKEQ